MRRSPAKIHLVVCKKQDSQTQSWLRSIPASWASGASSEEGRPARLSPSTGSDPKTGQAPDVAEGGAGPSSGMDTGERPALVTGVGGGPWAAWVAGVKRGAVAGSAAGVADSDIWTPVTCTSGKLPLGRLPLPAKSIAQIHVSHVLRDTACVKGEGRGGAWKGGEGKGTPLGFNGKLSSIPLCVSI